MKLIGIVGNNANRSYNRTLLQYMAKHFANDVELEVREIGQLPMFNENLMKAVPEAVTELMTAIEAADGVVIATPEYDHSITACLKSCLEWLSCVGHPLTDKPVMIVGASLGQQGTSWAQTQLREILNSPGINAQVLPGNQFMLSFASQKFDEQGQMTDARTVEFLEKCFGSFQRFVQTNRETQLALA